jgi:DNA-nicking Smr family endonuclease
MAKARPHRGSGGAPPHTMPDADRPDEKGAEAALFRAAVGDVKPLPRTERAEPTPPRNRRHMKRRAARDSAATADSRGSAADGGRIEGFEEVALEDDSPTGSDTLSFRRPGVRTRTLKHLRRGLYPVEDQLDLHGLSQAAARDSLGDFLDYSRGAGYRCVRIVHGKGYRSGARGPILKIAVNTWLKRHIDVMAFTSARPIDGGTGAVYVLLRA